MVRGKGLVRNGEEEGREMGWGSWGAGWMEEIGNRMQHELQPIMPYRDSSSM